MLLKQLEKSLKCLILWTFTFEIESKLQGNEVCENFAQTILLLVTASVKSVVTVVTSILVVVVKPGYDNEFVVVSKLVDDLNCFLEVRLIRLLMENGQFLEYILGLFEVKAKLRPGEVEIVFEML